MVVCEKLLIIKVGRDMKKFDDQPFNKSLSSPTSEWLDDSNNGTQENSISNSELSATPILPFLFLGSEHDAHLKRLEELDITYVLNVTSQLPDSCEKAGIRYKRLPAADSYHQNLKQYFEEAFQFIGKPFRTQIN
jgi:dual specificity MAP kinase phosphatase